MSKESEIIRFDDLSIPVRRSGRRKSVGITVDRDGSVAVSAPIECDFIDIEQYVRSRATWIYTKLIERGKLVSEPPEPKEFVDGASFLYLGKAYRLNLVQLSDDENHPPLRLQDDKLLFDRVKLPQAAQIFRRWYATQGMPIADSIVQDFAGRIAQPGSVEIRDIGFRWGSCTSEGKVLISWRAIQLPIDILTYVVAHELVHLLHRNHDDQFWSHLQRVLPDYEQRKRWLAENGEQYSAEF